MYMFEYRLMRLPVFVEKIHIEQHEPGIALTCLDFDKWATFLSISPNSSSSKSQTDLEQRLRASQVAARRRSGLLWQTTWRFLGMLMRQHRRGTFVNGPLYGSTAIASRNRSLVVRIPVTSSTKLLSALYFSCSPDGYSAARWLDMLVRLVNRMNLIDSH
jgi:hypothetical protein